MQAPLPGNDPARGGGFRQIVGLEWVRDDIAGYGGIPGDVTIMGRWVGTPSTGGLLGILQAAGLFHRAILMTRRSRSRLSCTTLLPSSSALAIPTPPGCRRGRSTRPTGSST